MKLLFQNIKRLIKIIVENIFLLAGAYLFTLNLFNFKHDAYYAVEGGAAGKIVGYDPSASYTDPAIYYYYNNDTITNLALGVILIILGLLLIKERYSKKQIERL